MKVDLEIWKFGNLKMKFPLNGVCFLIFLILSSCGNSKTRLEGVWKAGGELDSVHSWFINYTFEGNHYKKDGYPPLHEEGSFKVISDRNDSIVVELSPEKDSTLSPYESSFVIAPDKKSLRIATTIFKKEESVK